MLGLDQHFTCDSILAVSGRYRNFRANNELLSIWLAVMGRQVTGGLGGCEDRKEEEQRR
jgi:hypothetical protein